MEVTFKLDLKEIADFACLLQEREESMNAHKVAKIAADQSTDKSGRITYEQLHSMLAFDRDIDPAAFNQVQRDRFNKLRCILRNIVSEEAKKSPTTVNDIPMILAIMAGILDSCGREKTGKENGCDSRRNSGI